MNIYLIGYRCCGKTSVGKGVAEKLGFEFIDMDREIVRMEGTSIREMVNAFGWDYFRGKEEALLERISRGNTCVVATGGGIVTRKNNIGAMKKSGRIVWLKASPETVERRIREDETTGDYRPALTDKGICTEIRENIEARKPLYAKAADRAVDTDHLSIHDVIGAVVDFLNISGTNNTYR